MKSTRALCPRAQTDEMPAKLVAEAGTMILLHFYQRSRKITGFPIAFKILF